MGDSLLKPVFDWMNTWGLRSKDKGSDQEECAADEQRDIHRCQQLDHKSFTVRDSESDVLNQPLALPASSRCSVSCVFRDFLFEGHFVCPLITMKLTEGRRERDSSIHSVCPVYFMFQKLHEHL